MDNLQSTDSKFSVSIRNLFIYGTSTALLYTIIFNVLTIINILIDVKFKDSLKPLDSYYYSYYSNTSFEIAILIILTPIYLFFMRGIRKDIASNPEKSTPTVKKLASYLSLFLSGGFMSGSLIYTLYAYLDGQDLSTNFIAKFISILITASLVFGYYVSDLRNIMDAKKDKIFGLITLLYVLIIIFANFSIMGSPAEQRRERSDDAKIASLNEVQESIKIFWTEKNRLPKDMEEIVGFNQGYSSTKFAGIKYEVTNDTKFELCQIFETLADESTNKSYSNPYNYGGGMTYNDYGGGNFSSASWAHPIGQYCFERDIKKLVPPKTGASAQDQNNGTVYPLI